MKCPWKGLTQHLLTTGSTGLPGHREYLSIQMDPHLLTCPEHSCPGSYLRFEFSCTCLSASSHPPPRLGRWPWACLPVCFPQCRELRSCHWLQVTCHKYSCDNLSWHWCLSLEFQSHGCCRCVPWLHLLGPPFLLGVLDVMESGAGWGWSTSFQVYWESPVGWGSAEHLGKSYWCSPKVTSLPKNAE